MYSGRIDVILCKVIFRETQTNVENVIMKKKKRRNGTKFGLHRIFLDN